MLNHKIVTPLTIGVFLIMAVTGFLMFFHWNTDWNKLAHEWIGLMMIVVIGLHVTLNFKSFKRYFSDTAGRLIMGAFAILLALTFVIPPSNDGGGSPTGLVMGTIQQATIAEIAQLKHTDAATLIAKLEQAGFTNVNETQTVRELTGGDRGKTGQTLRILLTK